MVELVLARIGQRRVDLVVLHQRFLLARLQAQRIGRQARIQAALGHHEVLRAARLARGTDRHRPRPIDSTVSASALKPTGSRKSATWPSRARPGRGIPARCTGRAPGSSRPRTCGRSGAAGSTNRRRGRRRRPAARRRACDVPAWFMCLKTSPQRSTPGPLPYHMANTPSYLRRADQVAPAACPTPRWRPGLRSRRARTGRGALRGASCAFHSASSRPPSGEPR